MSEETTGPILALRSMGNTDYLALIILIEKGYAIWQEPDAKPDVLAGAELEGRRFWGRSWLELLGLVTMWEVRGDNWQLRECDLQPEDILHTIPDR